MITVGPRFLGFLPLLGAIALALGGRPAQTGTEQDKTLAEGMKVWRKAGAIDGGAACATCHSPDGIEIAAYNFSDTDIARRADPHVGYADAHLLVNYFHALRDKLHLYPLRDSIKDRPLQPGGTVLPGNTPAERDLAFGLELKEKLPLLFGPRIVTVDQAKAAEQQLLQLQPVNLRIGIPLNRLSEDVAHGDEHASIAQWLPEIAPQIPASDLQGWYAVEDEYLKSPTQENLHLLLVKHRQLADIGGLPGLEALSILKFRGLLVLQDRMRKHSEAEPLNLSAEMSGYHSGNPIWEVGDFARNMIGREPGSIGMDKRTQAKKLSGSSLSDQFQQLTVSWLWAGWLSDQGLFQTSQDDKTRLGMWISRSLAGATPYPIHNVYANARRQAVVSNDLASWGETIVRRRRIWDFAGLRVSGFMTAELPTEPEYRKLILSFTANCFRMNLLLLEEEIEKTHAVWIKQSTRNNVRDLLSFLRANEPEAVASTQQLALDLEKLIEAAKERNGFAPQLPP